MCRISRRGGYITPCDTYHLARIRWRSSCRTHEHRSRSRTAPRHLGRRRRKTIATHSAAEDVRSCRGPLGPSSEVHTVWVMPVSALVNTVLESVGADVGGGSAMTERAASSTNRGPARSHETAIVGDLGVGGGCGDGRPGCRGGVRRVPAWPGCVGLRAYRGSVGLVRGAPAGGRAGGGVDCRWPRAGRRGGPGCCGWVAVGRCAGGGGACGGFGGGACHSRSPRGFAECPGSAASGVVFQSTVWWGEGGAFRAR